MIGIDLAGKSQNPTGWALWENKSVQTCLLYTDTEILAGVARSQSAIIAVDAPLSFPKQGILRTADRKMIRKGYRVFPPSLPAMRKLTMRAIRLNKLISESHYRIIEVHPTSTRKALNMPLKDWRKIQTILAQIGLGESLTRLVLTSHEIDAATAALTAYLHMQGLTERIGDRKEGYIIVPKKQDWRNLQI